MRRRFQLPLQTADLIAGFMVWVILSSLLPYIKQDVYIPPDQIALVTAIPVVLGSVLRVPFGYCANLFKEFLVAFGGKLLRRVRHGALGIGMNLNNQPVGPRRHRR